MNYETRVQTYESQGITRSDAQGIVDAEDMQLVRSHNQENIMQNQIQHAIQNHPHRAAHEEFIARCGGNPSADTLRRADLIFGENELLTFTERRQVYKVKNRIGRLGQFAVDLVKANKIRKPRLAGAKRMYPCMVDGMTPRDYVHAYYRANSLTHYGAYDAANVTAFFQPLSTNPQSAVVLDNIEC